MKLLAGLLCLLTGCAGLYHTPPTPSADVQAPARFQFVAERLYRSAQPTMAELAYLHQQYGVVEVVKLNTNIEAVEPVMLDVDVIRIPLSVLSEPTQSELEAVVAWIDNGLKRGAVLVHCSHGEDRTGLAIAVWQMRHGLPWTDALADMVKHGWHPFRALWNAFGREAHW